MSAFICDYSGATCAPSPNFGERAGGRLPDIILLHYTGMPTADAALKWLCAPESQVSCHYFVHEDGRRYLVAGADGKGFVVKGEDLLAERRTGKQVLVLEPGREAAVCAPVEGDTVAVIGSNRKLLLHLLIRSLLMTCPSSVELIKRAFNAYVVQSKKCV